MSDAYQRPDPIQESDDVSGRSAAAWWLGILGTILACTVIAFLVIRWAAPGSREAVPHPQGRMGTGQVRSVYATTAHASRPDSTTTAGMDRYQWLEPGKVASVPVEEAMRLLAADTLLGGPR